MTVSYGPLALSPDPPGQLSNKRGSNTSSDALPQKWRYMNPRGSADPAGQVQFTATRLASEAGGSSQTPQVAWQSGWLGAPTTNALPVGLRQCGVAELNNRVYVVGGIDISGNIYSSVWSAPLNGGSVGTWRLERPMAYFWTVGATTAAPSPRYAHACCAATFGNSGGTGSAGPVGAGGTSWLVVHGGIGPNGFISQGVGIAATIYPDGTLGPWQTLYVSATVLGWSQLTPYPNQYVTQALVLTGGCGSSYTTAVTSTWVTSIRNAPANTSTWDVPNGWFLRLPDFPGNGFAGHVVAADWANSKLMVFRGSDGTSSSTGGYYLGFSIDTINWIHSVPGTWTSMTGGAAFQNDAGMVYFNCPTQGSWGGSPQSFVFLFGGSSSATLPPPIASAVTTVGIGTITWDTSNNPSVVWSTSAHPLPTVLSGIRAVVGGHHPPLQADLGPGPWPDANVARLTTFGGGNGTNASVSTVQSNRTVPAGSGDLLGSWVSGVGAGLQTTDLGTGGLVAASTDPTAPAGSQDVSINYGAVTTAQLSLADGDLIQYSAQFTDKLGGDPSPARFTEERIGQAPTISNLAVSSSATGQPVISWATSSGLGGGAQATWRVVVTRNSDSHLMFDSGVRYGQTNSVQLLCAPMLANAIAYTAAVTVTSIDSPVSGSSATGTATLGITPALSGVPATPTGFSVAADSTNKWMLVGGTAGANTTAIRIYYRETGSGAAYRLYAELAASSGVFSYKLMDKLSLGQAYDFQVSALGGSAASESATSSAISATIAADLDSPSGFLHLAGQPLTGALGTAVKASAWSEMSAESSFKTLHRFNSRRALVVQGVTDIRHIALEIFSAYSANVATLETLRDNLLAGGVVWWRDRNGVTLPMALEGPTSVRTSYPNHRDFSFVLVQVDDVYSPYLTAGSADGIPTLDYGSIPALDDAREQVA